MSDNNSVLTGCEPLPGAGLPAAADAMTASARYAVQRAQFVAGVRSMGPFMMSAIPVAMIAGALGVTSGLGYLKTLFLAMVVNSGTVQFVGIKLMHEGVSPASILLTTLILSLRLVFYGTVLSPRMNSMSHRWRILLGFGLIDALFFVVIDHLKKDAENDGNWRWFYLGGSVAMYWTWMIATVAGMLVGTSLSRFIGKGLDFPMTALFAAMLASTLGNWKIYCAAFSAGVIALAGSSLPYNSGLIAAAVGGAVVGALCDWAENIFKQKNTQAV